MTDREKVIEALQYLISGECTDTQFDYLDEIEAAIAMLKEQETMRCKNCRNNHQCGIQFNFADADDEENWFCRDFTPSSGQAVKWE